MPKHVWHDAIRYHCLTTGKIIIIIMPKFNINNMGKPIYSILENRHLLLQTTFNDIRGRFAGSIMGLLWIVLYPLLLLGSYAFIYIVIFNIRFAIFNSYEYVALIFCGLIPYIGFSEALGMGVSSVVANRNLIKNTLFPIELIPVKAVLVSQSTQFPGMGLLLIALIILNKLGIWGFLLPVIWFSQILFSIGLIWILSSLNVYFRDLQSIVPVFSIMLLFVTPIAYTPDMIPAAMKPFLLLNPLYYYVTAYQDALMLNRFPREGTLFIAFGIGIVMFMVGYYFFSKMKVIFVDNV
ncbi:ABC transporter permease [bacterium]|nr:ABC transporter permease [bacterium]